MIRLPIFSRDGCIDVLTLQRERKRRNCNVNCAIVLSLFSRASDRYAIVIKSCKERAKDGVLVLRTICAGRPTNNQMEES